MNLESPSAHESHESIRIGKDCRQLASNILYNTWLTAPQLEAINLIGERNHRGQHREYPIRAYLWDCYAIYAALRRGQLNCGFRMNRKVETDLSTEERPTTLVRSKDTATVLVTCILAARRSAAT